ncbi:MAG: M4 family metallopeptidase, partial [Myxococcota bacterium]
MRTYSSIFIALLCASALAACQGHNDNISDSGENRNSQNLFAGEDDSALQRAEALSRSYLQQNAGLIASDAPELWTEKVDIDDLSMAHTRFQQTVDNIPVFGAEAIVHLNPNGSLSTITDNLMTGLAAPTQPTLDDMQATDLAVMGHGGWDLISDEPRVDLQILRLDDGDHLAYRVQLAQLDSPDSAAMPVVFIDAVTGAELMSYDDLQTARNRRIHDAQNRNSVPGVLRISEGQGEIGDVQENQLYRFTGETYDYLLDVHGRDSYDNRGATMIASAHFSTDWVNAQWIGTQTRFGDGDGVTSGPLTVDDVVYHEWGHAVTDFSADLIYRNESGALNEATSDILAAAIEFHVGGNDPWLIGEDCWTPGQTGDALRYMNNPTLDGSSTDYYPERYTGSGDNGGVHLNSGIGNLFFYLLAEGGVHPRNKTDIEVAGITIPVAANIWYRALTQYMTASTNFAGARTATLNAASDLFGPESDERCQVENAWAAVGVGRPCSGAAP